MIYRKYRDFIAINKKIVYNYYIKIKRGVKEMNISKFKVLVAVILAICMFAGTAQNIAGSSVSANKKSISIKLNRKKVTVKKGEKFKLKAKVAPAKAKVKWKSSKKKVASVSSKGKVTAKTEGTARITATASYRANHKKYTGKAVCRVVVKNDESTIPTQQNITEIKRVSDISVGQMEYTLEIGKSVLINAAAVPADAYNPALNFASDNESVATVDAKGEVKAVKEGTAMITISAVDNSGVKKVVKVKVIYPVTSIQQMDTISLKVGDTYKISPEISPAGATLLSCNISNTKDYIALIAEDGTVTAKYPGITVVTVSSKTVPDVNVSFRIQVTDDFAPEEGFDKYDSSVEHGRLEGFYYPSDYRDGGQAHALAWFPPGYDESKQYNLLFCLHGGMDNEYYWTGDKGGTNDGCSGDKVLDNMYAKGLMEDTIVVFTSGVITYNANKEYPNLKNDPPVGSDWINHYLLEYEILNNLLPYMREEYPVMDGPEHTAICGLSMGCGQSFEIGFKNPDVFDYIGSFSAGPFEGTNQQFVRSEEDAAVMNDTVKLFFFMTGENDHMRDDSMRNFIKTCDGYGLNHVFYEVPGYGHEDACWDRCLYAFMKYAFK